MAMTTAAWSKAVSLKFYEKPFIINAMEKIFDYDKLFTIGVQTDQQWQTFQYAGFDRVGEVPELQLVPFSDAYELSPIIFTAVKYAAGFVFSEEMEEDNRNIGSWLPSLAKAQSDEFKYAEQIAMTSIFENAFDSNYSGWDGVELCGTHTTNNGATYTNYGGVLDISFSAVWDAADYFSSTVINEAGLPVKDVPYCIHYNPTRDRIVEKILKNTWEPDSSDRNVNTLNKFKMIPCPNRLLTSGKWFVHGKKMKDFLHFRRRKPITMKWDDAYQNIGRMCRVHERFSKGFSDSRFIFGYNNS